MNNKSYNKRLRKNKGKNGKGGYNRARNTIQNQEIWDRVARKLGDGIPKNLKVIQNQYNQSTSAGGFSFDFGGAVGQGLQVFQRIGDIIRISHVDFRIHMIVADVTNLLRFTLVYVHGFDIGAAFNNFFSNGVSGAPDVTSMFLPYARGKSFEVLYDRSYNLTQQSNNTQIITDFSVPVGRTISYQQSSPVSLAGNLYLIVMSDSSVAPHPNWQGTTRFWFSDL